MSSSLRLQLLTCLIVYVSNVHAIKVKFGTRDGPIRPLIPDPLPPPQPHRVPAPVWEERTDDSPDPNAHWRPPLFVPQPKYTQVIFNIPTTTQQPLNSAQRFVNSYKPTYQPINREPVQQYFNPSQILGSQRIPGIGIHYFVPAYINELQARKGEKRQEDSKHNDIETNDVSGPNKDSSIDLLWQYEKESTKRALRNTLEDSARQIYSWPEYVQPRH
ncbi:jg18580 [Pararge aegeria aegeria]|uniref:Jg18580 protein n=1 Tax=Pararge aegeria aegeria TaxID=348720 RepID=A0A8S4R621_9NEOP|nr:jg18580 [Pararge aegeria aegeria]